jgi:hypothetical protein
MKTANTERRCLECNTVLQGRIDKKYCDDSCRTAYYNHLKTNSTTAFMRKVNRVLAKNYRILKELNPRETQKVRREEMLVRGFNFKLFTTLYETQKGTCYYFVYDLGYVFLEEDMVALVRQKEYLKEQLFLK